MKMCIKVRVFIFNTFSNGNNPVLILCLTFSIRNTYSHTLENRDTHVSPFLGVASNCRVTPLLSSG